jgi:CRISPR-associated protein Cmr3
MAREWLIEPLDTLFFRGGEPFGMGDGGWLMSIFPPTPQTVQGIVRGGVLQLHCRDLDTFRKGNCGTCTKCNVHGAIGSHEDCDLGKIDLYGPYLVKGDTRYYPTPLDLVREKSDKTKIYALAPSDKAIECDLGTMRFPTLPSGADFGAVESVGGWISEAALNKYLDGSDAPAADKLLDDEEFFKPEPRVGLKRNHATHHAEDGMLYSISPLRFRDDVRLGVRVEGIDELMVPGDFAMKIGGEGRPCKIEVITPKEQPFPHGPVLGAIKLVFLQPADLGGGWKPTGSWGAMVSACTGRPQRIGGWNLVNGSKPMRSCVPAGSVYYFEDGQAIGEREGKTGEKKNIGFGHYRLGRWKS